MLSLFFLSIVVFSAKRLLRYLRYLQQEGYDVRRFLVWIFSRKAFDKRGSLAVLATAVIDSWIFGSALLIVLSLLEENPLKNGKIRLQMTDRAKRIYICSLGIFMAGLLGAFTLEGVSFWVAPVVLIQAIPLIMGLAVFLLSFDESRRQKKYREEAKKMLQDVAPFVIGITGSYGKTSTKHALGEVLQVVLGSAFWPSKGVNTEMGIAREIRTHLKKGTSYAVIEMGAYGRGSIEKLCRLTPPHAAIITEIGLAHLDRFGDPEIIRKAKAELAEAVPEEGILVINGDSPGARRIGEQHRKRTTLLYGYDNSNKDLDCWIDQYGMGPSGTTFTFHWKGQRYNGTTKLLGKPALANLAAAFTMACSLGADPEYALGAIANLKPVDNRLQLTSENGISYLRDAYNSNPQGFEAALDVLAQFSSHQKILMTPGMIELGNQSRELHEKIGRKAAQVCDLAILVGSLNRNDLMNGLVSGGMSKEKVIAVENRTEAFEVLRSAVKKGGAVLIENDLPDVYEAQERF